MQDFDTETLDLLRRLEASQKQFWNVCRLSANFMNMLIKVKKAKSVLELGTSNGYSAIWIAKALQETGGKLTTIEFYRKRIDLAVENFRIAKVDDIITVLEGSILKILPTLEFDFDFVFIDASKPEYLEYFEYLRDRLPYGAILLADNVTSHKEKVSNFLDAIEKDERFQTQLLNFEGWLLFALKH